MVKNTTGSAVATREMTGAAVPPGMVIGVGSVVVAAVDVAVVALVVVVVVDVEVVVDGSVTGADPRSAPVSSSAVVNHTPSPSATAITATPKPAIVHSEPQLRTRGVITVLCSGSVQPVLVATS